jgi:type III pantothenate kinase
MLFTVDVGNSHTVSGLFKKGRLFKNWRVKSERDRTADELAIRYNLLFTMAGLNHKDVTGFIISSVVPTLEKSWVKYAKKYHTLHCPPISVNHLTNTSINIKIENPVEIGADRIVNAVAAYNQIKDALIVIDFGTAITFDCVSKEGNYLGGTIHPGIGISLDALAGRTAKLPRIEIDTPPKEKIGRTTASAIHSGMLYGFGGLVDRMVTVLGKEISNEQKLVKTIATGGMAELITPFTSTIDQVDPYLTLKGLELIHAGKYCL